MGCGHAQVPARSHLQPPNLSFSLLSCGAWNDASAGEEVARDDDEVTEEAADSVDDGGGGADLGEASDDLARPPHVPAGQSRMQPWGR